MRTMRTWTWSSWQYLRPMVGLGGALAVFSLALISAVPAAVDAATESVDPAGALAAVDESVQAVVAVLNQSDLSAELRRKRIERRRGRGIPFDVGARLYPLADHHAEHEDQAGDDCSTKKQIEDLPSVEADFDLVFE